MSRCSAVYFDICATEGYSELGYSEVRLRPLETKFNALLTGLQNTSSIVLRTELQILPFFPHGRLCWAAGRPFLVIG